MKLSSETLAILKNFATINPGIVFKEGNTLSTMSQQKNILADAIVNETFNYTFGIYDLNNFLSVISLFKDGAELEFDEKNVYIRGYSGRSKIKYRYAAIDIFEPLPEKRPVINDPDVVFRLTESDFQWIMKSANVLSSPNISIESDGDEVMMTSFDTNDDAAPTNSVTLPNVESTGKYNLIFKTENLKMLPGTYNIEASSRGISKFVGETNNVTYYVALEIESKYGE